MINEINLFYDPSEDGGWDTYELGEEIEIPLMFGLDSGKLLTECGIEISELSLGTYQICAKILDKYDNDLLLDGGLKFNMSTFPDMSLTGTPTVGMYIRGIGSFFDSPLWRPQWPDSLGARCTYRFRVSEIRRLQSRSGWKKRDTSGAKIVNSMGPYDSEAWFFMSCNVLSEPHL